MEGSTSDSRLSKRAVSEGSVEEFEDRFKLLPMSILLVILSFLPVEHSARTSILAKYWKGLWLLSPRLDFDGSELVKKLRSSGLNESEWGSRYVEWVNNVLSAHKALHSDKDYVFEGFRFCFGSCHTYEKHIDSDKGHVFEEFRFCFGLRRTFDKHIDSWLNYVLSLKVQHLELSPLNKNARTYYLGYHFPRLHDPRTDEYAGETSRHRKPVVLSEFRILKSFTLSDVGVSGEAIQFLLRKFPVLERLKVCQSDVLVSIEVCGRSVALKYLEVTNCMKLQNIVVRDSGLVSLKVTQNFQSEVSPELVLENVPMLENVWVSVDWAGDQLSKLFTCLSGVKNLKVLTLSVKIYVCQEDGARFFSELPGLKQLVLTVYVTDSQSCFISLKYLLSSIPELEKFVLKVKYVDTKKEVVEYEEPLNRRLEHLKVVEVRGYQGRGMDEYLLMYLRENAKALERIVLEPSGEKDWPFPGESTRNEEAIRAENKARAERLKAEFPQSVQVVIV